MLWNYDFINIYMYVENILFKFITFNWINLVMSYLYCPHSKNPPSRRPGSACSLYSHSQTAACGLAPRPRYDLPPTIFYSSKSSPNPRPDYFIVQFSWLNVLQYGNNFICQIPSDSPTILPTPTPPINPSSNTPT